MPRPRPSWSLPLLALGLSGCCSLFGPDTRPFIGGNFGLAVSDRDSDIGIGLDQRCDCERVDGLGLVVAVDGRFPSEGNAYTGRVLGEYRLPGVDSDLRPFVSAGGLVEYDTSVESYVQGVQQGGFTRSETHFGVAAGVGLTYFGFERTVPYVSLERQQVGGRGFQVVRFGARWGLWR